MVLWFVAFYFVFIILSQNRDSCIGLGQYEVSIRYKAPSCPILEIQEFDSQNSSKLLLTIVFSSSISDETTLARTQLHT
jgi:hypothetical protein